MGELIKIIEKNYGSPMYKLLHEDNDALRTPKKKRGRTVAKFICVTPRAKLLPTFDCTLCPRKYNLKKTLVCHMRKSHPNERIPTDLKSAADPVHCKICGIEQQREHLNRHLADIHNFKNHVKGASLRGFLTFDEVMWKPLWLPKKEENPPIETEIEVPVKSGYVVVYGVSFKIDEVNPNCWSESPKAAEASATTSVSEDGCYENKNDQLIESASSVSKNVYGSIGNNDDNLSLTDHYNDEKVLDDVGLSCSGNLFVPSPDLKDVVDHSMDVIEHYTDVSPSSKTKVVSVDRSMIEIEHRQDDSLKSTSKEVSVDNAVTSKKVKVVNFCVEIEDGTLWSHEDSDHENWDSGEFEKLRKKNKQIRLVSLMFYLKSSRGLYIDTLS